MKKILIVLLSAAMLLSVTACHGNTSSSVGTQSGNGTSSDGTYSGVTVSGAVSRPPVVVKKSPYIVKTPDYK
jgi:predicted small secreted protein